MNREDFQVYIEGKKVEIDEDYSNGIIDERVRNELYNNVRETEERYERIKLS